MTARRVPASIESYVYVMQEADRWDPTACSVALSFNSIVDRFGFVRCFWQLACSMTDMRGFPCPLGQTFMAQTIDKSFARSDSGRMCRIGRLNVDAAEKFGIYGKDRNTVKAGLPVTNKHGVTVVPEQVTFFCLQLCSCLLLVPEE